MHEMPQDRDTLSKIGLRDFPRWWKELNALNTGVWRQQRSPGSGAGAPLAASPQLPIESGAGLGTIIAPTATANIQSSQSEGRAVAAFISERTVEAVVATPSPRSHGPLIRQRVPRIRASSAEYQSPSPSPTKGSNSTASPPEAPQAPRFVPGVIPPHARALRVQRLMSPESSPEGGVSVQGDAAGLQRIDTNTGDVAKDSGFSLIQLEGPKTE